MPKLTPSKQTKVTRLVDSCKPGEATFYITYEDCSLAHPSWFYIHQLSDYALRQWKVLAVSPCKPK